MLQPTSVNYAQLLILYLMILSNLANNQLQGMSIETRFVIISIPQGVLEYLTFDISRWRWDIGRSNG